MAGRQRSRRGNRGLPLNMKNRLIADITPGEILEEEFLKPMDITQYRLARDIGVPPRRINEIVKGQRAITADTGLPRLTPYPQTRTPNISYADHYANLIREKFHKVLLRISRYGVTQLRR